MNSLVDTLDRYAVPFFKAYGDRLGDGHRHALSAIRLCRTEHYGELALLCTDCDHKDVHYRSCGHRSCHRCQHHDNRRWLVTFSYRDGATGKRCTRTVSGARFVWLLIQHVLPTHFRRAHDYGFLHGNARKTLIRAQWFLKVAINKSTPIQPRPPFRCKQCGCPMKVIEFTTPDRLSG